MLTSGLRNFTTSGAIQVKVMNGILWYHGRLHRGKTQFASNVPRTFDQLAVCLTEVYFVRPVPRNEIDCNILIGSVDLSAVQMALQVICILLFILFLLCRYLCDLVFAAIVASVIRRHSRASWRQL